jgi:hypothetical protein
VLAKTLSMDILREDSEFYPYTSRDEVVFYTKRAFQDAKIGIANAQEQRKLGNYGVADRLENDSKWFIDRYNLLVKNYNIQEEELNG